MYIYALFITPTIEFQLYKIFVIFYTFPIQQIAFFFKFQKTKSTVDGFVYKQPGFVAYSLSIVGVIILLKE